MPSYSRSPINVLIQHPVAISHSLIVRSRPPLNKIWPSALKMKVLGEPKGMVRSPALLIADSLDICGKRIHIPIVAVDWFTVFMTHWTNLAEWRSHFKNSAFSNGQPADVSACKLPKGKNCTYHVASPKPKKRFAPRSVLNRKSVFIGCTHLMTAPSFSCN